MGRYGGGGVGVGRALARAATRPHRALHAEVVLLLVSSSACGRRVGAAAVAHLVLRGTAQWSSSEAIAGHAIYSTWPPGVLPALRQTVARWRARRGRRRRTPVLSPRDPRGRGRGRAGRRLRAQAGAPDGAPGAVHVLYMVPDVAVVTCMAYEQHGGGRRARPPRTHSAARGDGALAAAAGEEAWPEHAVLMLKHFMTLVGGVTSGVWVWSGKTAGRVAPLPSRRCCPAGGVGGGARAAAVRGLQPCSEASSALTHRTAITPSTLHAKSSAPPSL
ncbi:unnamed protein product [Boreogadus saida]